MNKSNLSVQSIGRAIANALSTKREHTKIPTRSGRSRTRRVARGRNSGISSWSRSLPASYANHVRPSFRVLNKSANSMRVAGCDLVYPLPNSISTGPVGDFLFSVIPANPAYWTGTRIAQIAPGYMNYRPISMTFHYIPQVSVTQPGSVIFGTLWNGSAPGDDIQQALNTSNGGGIINCYVPASTRVVLGSNLQQNLFTLNGDINPDTSPFLFAAIARGCVGPSSTQTVIPGYFMVDYVYDFKNAMGQTWLFDRSLATPFPVTDWSLPNRSLVLLQGISGYGPGTVFDCEVVNDEVRYLYRGTEVVIPTGTYVQRFENGQTASLQELARSARESISLPFTIVSASHGPWIYYPAGTSTPTGGRKIIHDASEHIYRVVGSGSSSAYDQWFIDQSPLPTPIQFLDNSGTPVWSVNADYDIVSDSLVHFPLDDIPIQ